MPAIAAALCLWSATPTLAQSSGALSLLEGPTDLPMISYTTIGRVHAISSLDVREIEISSSGGITDIFVRLFPTAARELAEWTTLADGFAISFAICGATVLRTESLSPNTSGALYIPNLTFTQADALRSVWHGRETCFTLPPEVFPIGQ